MGTLAGMKFMGEVETPRGKGLVIGKMAEVGVLVAVRREGERGAGRNVVFGWCGVHGVIYEEGEECGVCGVLEGEDANTG